MSQRKTIEELESYVRDIDTAAYARTRNQLGGSTELSEYITRGYISLPRVRELVLENNSESDSYKFINELAWREYWQTVWRARGNDIFEYIRPLKQNVRNGIPTAVLAANTGIKALDDGIKQLQNTGYIHNHMRLWLAGLICNVAHCEWKIAANWMHSYLIDGDYASNHLSWQWVAGSYTGKPYLPQQDNINKYTDTVQHDTYLDQPYEVISDMPVPGALAEITNDLPRHDATAIEATITVDDLKTDSKIYLYSPWTLDPGWRKQETGTRILLLDPAIFKDGAFSQNVLDSITWFARQIPDMHILYTEPSSLEPFAEQIIRKSYAGIADWPGQTDPYELLFPNVPEKFYPSFSAFWKQCQKTKA